MDEHEEDLYEGHYASKMPFAQWVIASIVLIAVAMAVFFAGAAYAKRTRQALTRPNGQYAQAH